MIKSAEYFIKQLKLEPHPEGGHYRRIYESSEFISKENLPKKYGSKRHYSTSIYYLLNKTEVSKFHKLKSDEIWHYYFGSSAMIYIIDESGKLNIKKLGPNIDEGEEFQVIIKSNSWFASELSNKDSFILVGCTVAPGFDFEDFELAEKSDLINNYPDYLDIISKFTE